mmetsp:Transcript_81244/g.243540  ORF Transcript_81244/g.243540 Transcript_81244/m.243540 type:complete len:321 (-) Transcript_81244:779-1741(-)
MRHVAGSTSNGSSVDPTGSGGALAPTLAERAPTESLTEHGTLNGLVSLKRSDVSCPTMCEPKQKSASSSAKTLRGRPVVEMSIERPTDCSSKMLMKSVVLMPGMHDSASSSYTIPSGSAFESRSATSMIMFCWNVCASLPASNLIVTTTEPPASTEPVAGETAKLPSASEPPSAGAPPPLPPLAGAAAAASGSASSPCLRSANLNSNSPVLVSSNVRSLVESYCIGPKLMPRGTTAYLEKTPCIDTLIGIVSSWITSPVSSSVNCTRTSWLSLSVSSLSVWSTTSTFCRAPAPADAGSSLPSDGVSVRMSRVGGLRSRNL